MPASASLRTRLSAWFLVAAGATTAAAGGTEELFFGSAKISIRLKAGDSIAVVFSAPSEDLMNTVGVFPLGESANPKTFGLFEDRIESYLKQRVPVWADRKRLDLNVIQWKPGGKGRKDGLDSASINVDDLFITLGSRLPKGAKALEIRADMWVERSDADATMVEYTLSRNGRQLSRQWAKTEKTLRFPLHPDTLAALERKSKPDSL